MSALRWLLFFLSLFWMGCASTPHPTLDYVLAREAYGSAQEVDAARYAPSAFEKAEGAYRRAVENYNKGLYDESSRLFRLARSYAERAENAARVARMKAGDEGI